MGRNGILSYKILSLLYMILLTNCHSLAVDGLDTLHLGASLPGNRTIISKNGAFELGFFCPSGTNNWYIGIWYAQLSEKDIVWVANREIPVRNRPGVLQLSREGNLGLFDAGGASVWWPVNVTKKVSRAVILDSGNFVMVGNGDKSETVWQSFDHPVDTWLPGMKFDSHDKLVGWRSSLDPAPGLFSFQLDPAGAERFVLRWNDSVQYWESGIWDGKNFSANPELSGFYNFSVENSSSGVDFSYKMVPTINVLSRFVLEKNGRIRLYTLNDGHHWSMNWSQPMYQCTIYGLCGAFAFCNDLSMFDFASCSCMDGFIPRDNRAWHSKEWWTSGCVRQSQLNCDAKDGNNDSFLQYYARPSADHLIIQYAKEQSTVEGCRTACLHNCLCTAFTVTYNPFTCEILFGNILSIYDNRIYQDDFFIRSPVSDDVFSPVLEYPQRSSRVRALFIVLPVAAALTAILALLFIWRKRRRLHQKRSEDDETVLPRKFSYKELKIATRSFRYKLGSGGFGSVFKGALPDGTLVGVKKLEGSGQGEKQFRAEIRSVGDIQHVNLIRLRGICAEGSSRRLLVYDYMPNGSLNSFLFGRNCKGERTKELLDWKTRFEIALGTARGLVYLHDECRERIIHGDVKPENILLDADFSPKLADFGLAKLVGRDFSHVLTTTRGTRGYLAPEWISGLPITPKVDVYSFGMTLLEIISGRRNLDLNVQESSKYYFPPWAATQIYKGADILGIVEEGVAHSADVEEVRRAVVVSMLCIQDDENARPSMAQVVLMLEGKTDPHQSQFSNSALIMMDQQPSTGSSESDCDGDSVGIVKL